MDFLVKNVNVQGFYEYFTDGVNKDFKFVLQPQTVKFNVFVR